MKQQDFINLISKNEYLESAAIECAGIEIKYTELFERARKLSKHIKRIGQEVEFVVLVGEKDISYYVAILATIFAGKCVVSKKQIQDIFGPDHINIVTSDFEDKTDEIKSTCRLDSSSADSDYVYVAFTSGSTGTPKGIPIKGSQLSVYFHSLFKRFPISSSDRILCTFATNFDLFYHNFFSALISGATLIPNAPDMPLLLPNIIEQKNISIWHSVPTVGSLISRLLKNSKNYNTSLRLSFFCGEPLTSNLVADWKTYFPHTAVINLYGPTECTITAMSYTVTSLPDTEIIPIGEPFSKYSIFFRDDDGNITNPEENGCGEILIGGEQVFDGYIGYLDAPFEFHDRIKCYRTGDLAHYRNGIFHFSGRRDRQIKILGNRIELDGIEAMMSRVLGARVAIVARKSEADRLNQYTLVLGMVECSEDAVLKAQTNLHNCLPSCLKKLFLLPSDSLPINSNGKISYFKVEAEIIDALNFRKNSLVEVRS